MHLYPPEPLLALVAGTRACVKLGSFPVAPRCSTLLKMGGTPRRAGAGAAPCCCASFAASRGFLSAAAAAREGTQRREGEAGLTGGLDRPRPDAATATVLFQQEASSLGGGSRLRDSHVDDAGRSSRCSG